MWRAPTSSTQRCSTEEEAKTRKVANRRCRPYRGKRTRKTLKSPSVTTKVKRGVAKTTERLRVLLGASSTARGCSRSHGLGGFRLLDRTGRSSDRPISDGERLANDRPSVGESVPASRTPHFAARAKLVRQDEREARDSAYLGGESETHGRTGRRRVGNGTESVPTHTRSNALKSRARPSRRGGRSRRTRCGSRTSGAGGNPTLARRSVSLGRRDGKGECLGHRAVRAGDAST